MLDSYLVDFLVTLPEVTSTVGSRIYRNRVPEFAGFPYIVVGDARDIDFGPTATGNLLREVGTYSIVIADSGAGGSFDRIDPLAKAVVNALKTHRNAFIPSDSASRKIWVQCLLVTNREQFNNKPDDGNEVPILGYIISVKGAYDV